MGHDCRTGNPGVLAGWNFNASKKEMENVVHSLVEEVVRWDDMPDERVRECLFQAYRKLAEARVERWRATAVDVNDVGYSNAEGNMTAVKHANCAGCCLRFPVTREFWCRSDIDDLQRRLEDRGRLHPPRTCITCTIKLGPVEWD